MRRHLIDLLKKFEFYQASSSEMFGDSVDEDGFQRESTPMTPVSPYGAAKLFGFNIVKSYRKAYGLHASNGILFNHESPRRGETFVTRKISRGVSRIKEGIQEKLTLGNLDAKRDWGYAPEFVEGMWKIMQQKHPDDFVLATNETHTVKEFVKLAFQTVDMDWKKFVKIDKKLFRLLEVNALNGDYSKARKKIGWKPKINFKELVKIMVSKDLERWTRWKKGENFPWDANNYINEKKVLFRRYNKI